MHRVIISTDNVPETERFAYWREQVSEGLFGTSPERNKDQEIPFKAHADVWIGASIVRFRFRTDGYPVFRRPRDIARRGWDNYISLYRELGPGIWLGNDETEFVSEPGDLIVGDATIPFSSKPRVNYNSEILFLPRMLFDPHLPVSQHPRLHILRGQNALSELVKAYLDALAEQVDALDDTEMDILADNFCRLLAVAFGAGEQPAAARAAQLAAAERYIKLNLADPKLSPEKAAAALKMSVRRLHVLFEQSGMSFAQYVLRRRLEECRAALIGPSGTRSITDIALGWGFNSLATFHRNFRQAFGATPGELRSEAQTVVGFRARGFASAHSLRSR
jgi:AraC-like DNA-binding protein